ncbi:hypothetical protein C1645_743265 [Glomus cerebriforme]|uniref:SAM domain-containing protein n=1 Tax=Glomus cerebriforme TaxID=658196 RepID=A0A397SA14_9GLOM|nr:hypothetical protein C1645_743265 [Glomus cerebriforme]
MNKDSEAVEQDKQLITEPEQDEASDINNEEYSEIEESENENKKISFKLVIRRDANASIPKIQKFLEDLDEEFGVGKFTYYSKNFVNELIDVLDILELKESDFDKLGITNIGIKTKLVRKAKQYCK